MPLYSKSATPGCHLPRKNSLDKKVTDTADLEQARGRKAREIVEGSFISGLPACVI